MLTIISLLYSLLLFSTLLLCHHGPSTSCPAMIRPHGRLDSSSVCLCVCVLTWFPLCTCFSGDCVCLCVTLPCHNITGPTDALSSHKPFLSATLSLCPHTPPPPHTHKHTTSFLLYRSQTAAWTNCAWTAGPGREDFSPLSLPSSSSPPLLVFLAQAVSKTISIVSGRLGTSKASWRWFLGLCIFSQLHNCRQIHRLKKNPSSSGVTVDSRTWSTKQPTIWSSSQK